jgi:hypothetical protein
VRYPGAVVDPDTGDLISDAQAAEAPYTAFVGTRHETIGRLVVRRVLDANTQDPLFPVWRYHPFFTNTTEPVAPGRHHPLRPRHLRDRLVRPHRRTWPHQPSGWFPANAAWNVLAAITHNLRRRHPHRHCTLRRRPRRHPTHPPDQRRGPLRPPPTPTRAAPTHPLAQSPRLARTLERRLHNLTTPRPNLSTVDSDLCTRRPPAWLPRHPPDNPGLSTLDTGPAAQSRRHPSKIILAARRDHSKACPWIET